MALLTFAPDPKPEVQTSSALKFRAQVAQMGDGYEQRIADGINVKRWEVSLVWRVLSYEDADELVAFFESHPKWRAFRYVLPWEGSARTWRCDQVTRSETGPRRASITADLVEVFDL